MTCEAHEQSNPPPLDFVIDVSMLRVFAMKKQHHKAPIVLDPSHPANRPTGNAAVEKYKAGILERAAQQQQQRSDRPAFPNIAAADQLYKPGKDGPMTIAQIAQAQNTMSSGGSSNPEERRERGLSPQTVAGLQALQSAMQEQRTNMNPDTPNNLPTPAMAAPNAQPAPPPPAPAPTPVAPPAAPAEPATPTSDPTASDKKARVSDALSELDDLEFERVLRGMQKDVINNEREREAVRSRVKPIDIIKGISTGEFTQDVPIIPNTLLVKYRTITPMENQAVRLILFRMFDEDKRREALGAELFGLMQTVCSVSMINGASFGQHLKGEGYNLEFDESGFTAKFKRFLLMPMPMIHALGTHGFWFEQRVREAFTTDHLKNG